MVVVHNSERTDHPLVEAFGEAPVATSVSLSYGEMWGYDMMETAALTPSSNDFEQMTALMRRRLRLPREIASNSPHDIASDLPREIASDSPHDIASDPPREIASDSPHDIASDPPGEIASNSPHDIASDPPHDIASDPPREIASNSPHDIASDTPALTLADRLRVHLGVSSATDELREDFPPHDKIAQLVSLGPSDLKRQLIPILTLNNPRLPSRGIEYCQRILQELIEKRARLVERGIKIADERRNIAYDAHADGDKAARARLDKLHTEVVFQAAELASIDNAIETARARLDIAQHEAAVKDNADARKAREILSTELAENGMRLDEAIKILIAESNRQVDILRRLHALGVAFPSDKQALIHSGIAVSTAVMSTPWQKQVDSRYLAPGEKTTFAKIYQQWAEHIERQLANRLPRGREGSGSMSAHHFARIFKDATGVPPAPQVPPLLVNVTASDRGSREEDRHHAKGCHLVASVIEHPNEDAPNIAEDVRA